mmetsp:Transcript_9369/g.28566  ORF Transcript_9369/g.28566 Transcript_9369/m.28566 type:complete len:232 (-) Transcript_9369:230-925(-)
MTIRLDNHGPMCVLKQGLCSSCAPKYDYAFRPLEPTPRALQTGFTPATVPARQATRASIGLSLPRPHAYRPVLMPTPLPWSALHLARHGHQLLDELLNRRCQVLVHQLARHRVERSVVRRRKAVDRDGGLVEEVQVEEHTDTTQVHGRECGAVAAASAHDGRGLAGKAVGVLGRPVDARLEHRRHAEVVLRVGKQDAVSGSDLRSHLADRLGQRRVVRLSLPQVIVVDGQL